MRGSTVGQEKVVQSPFPIAIFYVCRSDNLPKAFHEGLRLAIRFWPEGRNLLTMEAISPSETLKIFAVKRRSVVCVVCVRNAMDREHFFHG